MEQVSHREGQSEGKRTEGMMTMEEYFNRCAVEYGTGVSWREVLDSLAEEKRRRRDLGYRHFIRKPRIVLPPRRVKAGRN